MLHIVRFNVHNLSMGIYPVEYHHIFESSTVDESLIIIDRLQCDLSNSPFSIVKLVTWGEFTGEVPKDYFVKTIHNT